MRVLLASNSPRRRELLRSLVPEFDVEAFPVDERFSGKTPEETVSEIARRKLVAAKEMFWEARAICRNMLFRMSGFLETVLY